jgi:hypothetical protein
MSNRWLDLEQEVLRTKQAQKRSLAAAQDYDVSQVGNSSLLALAQEIEHVRSQQMNRHAIAEQLGLLFGMNPNEVTQLTPGDLPVPLQDLINQRLRQQNQRELTGKVTVVATSEPNVWNIKDINGLNYHARLNNNQLEIHDKPPAPTAQKPPLLPKAGAQAPPLIAPLPVQNIPANLPPPLPTAPKPALQPKPLTQIDLLEPGALQRWDSLSEITGIGSGVTGVIFTKNIFNQEIVIKGLEEPPQRLLLAQNLMSRIPNIRSAKNRAVAIKSPEGQEILKRLAARVNPNNPAQGGILSKFQNAQTILLMEKLGIVSGQDLDQADYAKLQGVRMALQDPDFWRGLGALYFIDQFLGNTDRLEANKWQNVFIEWTSRKVAALDNDAILPVYISALADGDVQPPKIQQTSPETWLMALITGDDNNEAMLGRKSLYDSKSVQDKKIANLSAICGPLQPFQARVQQQFINNHTWLLREYQSQATRQPPKPNAAAIATTLQNLNLNSMKKMFFDGALLARQTIANLKIEEFRQILTQIETTSDKAFYQPDLMFNWIAFEIRYEYLRQTFSYSANVVKWETPRGWVDRDIMTQLLKTYNSVILNAALDADASFDVATGQSKVTTRKAIAPVNKT